jgi:hypothetical protein
MSLYYTITKSRRLWRGVVGHLGGFVEHWKMNNNHKNPEEKLRDHLKA